MIDCMDILPRHTGLFIEIVLLYLTDTLLHASLDLQCTRAMEQLSQTSLQSRS